MEVARTCAEPFPTPEITPDELTVATKGLLEVHVNKIVLALTGKMVTTACTVPPTFTTAFEGRTDNDVTGILVVKTAFKAPPIMLPNPVQLS